MDQAIDDLVNGFGLSMVWSGLLDASGHFDGPESPGLDETMRKIDPILGEFFRRLEEEGLDETTDVVIIGDHGL